MHIGAAQVERRPPVIVDHERRAGIGAGVTRARDLLAHFGVAAILHAQLHKSRTCTHDTGDPRGILNDRIEGIECAHVNARPKTGVEGAAMSRGSIGSASQAARPASIASANARAIAGASPALAIAVLSRTAS